MLRVLVQKETANKLVSERKILKFCFDEEKQVILMVNCNRQVCVNLNAVKMARKKKGPVGVINVGSVCMPEWDYKFTHG